MIYIYDIINTSDERKYIIMQIRIYQLLPIDSNCDKIFEPYKNDISIDMRDYDCVFEGAVDAHDLEDVFYIFNCQRPEGFVGRSLSVSDLVEVCEWVDYTPIGLYYCDSIGFKRIV